MNRLKESWGVAFEYMIVCFSAIAGDASGKLTLGTVYERGSTDTYLAEARTNAKIFRIGEGTSRVDDDNDEDEDKDEDKGKISETVDKFGSVPAVGDERNAEDF